MKTLVASMILLVLIALPQVGAAQDAMFFPAEGVLLTALRYTQHRVSMVSDNTGGAILVWLDQRNQPFFDIFAQRMNDEGKTLWQTDGNPVNLSPDDEGGLVAVSDGAGGAILVWQRLAGDGSIHAQRLSSTGTVLWGAAGVVVCDVTGLQLNPRVIPDGQGGVIMAWEDNRIATHFDIFAQRVNGSGAAQWVANGVDLCTIDSNRDSHQLVSDGAGGAIVVWRDFRFGPLDTDIFAQRISSTGIVQWAPGGNFVCGALENQESPQIVPDQAGGGIVGWSDRRIGNQFDIFAQRVNAAGSPQWEANGVALVIDPLGVDDQSVAIAEDGSGGAVFSWERELDPFFPETNIFAQRMSPAGARTWGQAGKAVCTAPGNQFASLVVFDGRTGYVVGWLDEREVPGRQTVYAQKLRSSGDALWDQDGRAMAIEPCVKTGLVGGVATGTGAPSPAPMMFAWSGDRNGDPDVYAQRLETAHGYYGHPEPKIRSVADVENDQGGVVAVNWAAGCRDVPGDIEFYSIWRAVDAIPPGASALSTEDLDRLTLADADASYLVAAGHYFERVGTQSAHGWAGYSFAAPTRADSLAVDAGNEMFMVAAHLVSDNFVAFASNEVSGHSVDNLAPLAPFLLTAQRVGADVHLNWNRAVAPDLRDYAIYRATASGVTPAPIHFLSSAEDTLAVDANAPSTALYYIVTAFDVHTNQSAPSNEANVGGSTGIGDAPALTALTVLGNYPNPFAIATELEIGLPAPSDISIDVFDVAGRRVSEVEVRGARAGWQRIPFSGRGRDGSALASGVYFYRVTASGTTITRKMVITR